MSLRCLPRAPVHCKYEDLSTISPAEWTRVLVLSAAVMRMSGSQQAKPSCYADECGEATEDGGHRPHWRKRHSASVSLHDLGPHPILACVSCPIQAPVMAPVRPRGSKPVGEIYWLLQEKEGRAQGVDHR